MDIDHGQLVYPSLEDVAVVMGLDELAPVGRRAAGGRHWRRLEWFTQVRENLPDRSRLSDKRDEPGVLARTQFHQWNCVLPAVKRDLIGKLPRMRRSGRTDLGGLEVSLNALTSGLGAPLRRGVSAGGVPGWWVRLLPWCLSRPVEWRAVGRRTSTASPLLTLGKIWAGI